MSDGSPRPPTWIQRARYRLDNLLARGTWAALLLLGVFTLVVVLLSAALLTAFSVSFTSDDGSTPQEDFWQSLLRVMDPGTMAGDVGWGRRILALLVTIFGLLVAGTLIGILAAGVEDRITRMRRGRSVVVEEGHVVVLGPAHRSAAVIAELLRSGVAPAGIVAMDDGEPDVLRGAVQRLGATSTRACVVRSGDATAPTDLAIVRLDAARSVVVVGDDDAWTTRVVLAVTAVVGREVGVPVVVEVRDPQRAHALQQAIGPHVRSLATDVAVARIAAFAVGHRGLTHVVEEIIDPAAVQLRLVDATPHVGRPFGTLVRAARRGRPMGIADRDGRVELAPDDHREVADGDQLVVLASGDVDLRDDGAEVGAGGRSSEPIVVRPPAPTPQHLLVFGRTRFAATFLDGWAPLAPPGSDVTVVGRAGEDHPIPEAVGVAGIGVTFLDGPPSEVVDSIGSTSPTTVALLAPDDADETADAETILDLMTIEQHLARAGHRPQFVVELVDPQSHALLPPLLPDDHVVSRSLAAQMLTQLADEPARQEILLALYGAAGPSLVAIDPAQLGVDRPSPWSDIVARCCDAGLVPLGWTSTTSTSLDPPPDALLDPDDGASIVVVADPGGAPGPGPSTRV